jgi:hypothetical protein
MTARSHFRGHPTIFVNDTWVYEDTKEKAGFDGAVRPCKKCGAVFDGSNTGDADPCLGELLGVNNACCGHSIREKAYIRFNNGLVIKGFEVESPNQSLDSDAGSRRI